MRECSTATIDFQTRGVFAGHLQCTVGGFDGEMGPFYLFNQPLTTSVRCWRCCVSAHSVLRVSEQSIFTLSAIGSGTFAQPIIHALREGPVAVFSPPPGQQFNTTA